MATLPTSFNPSDYEYIIKTLAEGPTTAKAEALKRLNTLIATDKKQFASYAKRVVLALQELLLEPKEDINLLASTLAHEIINLNPREIEYYVRTKLLKNIVRNLGDVKPQLRKTSHYCLLAFVKTYKSFDDLISAYISEGLIQPEENWQLRQKCINSFQSILIMEVRYLNWSSNEFRRLFELLLGRLSDESPYVQKASEQCLISLCKLEGIRTLVLRLASDYFETLSNFVQAQKKSGALPSDLRIDSTDDMIKQSPHTTSGLISNNFSRPAAISDFQESKTLSTAGQSLLFSMDNKKSEERQSYQVIPASRTDDIARRSPDRRLTPLKLVKRTAPEPTPEKQKNPSLLPQIKSPGRIQHPVQPVSSPPIKSTKEGLHDIMGKKLLEDLKNEKDWKARAEAIEQLQRKFDECKGRPDMEGVMRSLLPILIRMLGDSNFKISLAALKMIQEIFETANLSLDAFLPSFIQKLGDSKVSIRQNVSKIIRSQFAKSSKPEWIDHLLNSLKKTPSAYGKQEILGLLYHIYEDEETVNFPVDKMLAELAPLMEDSKTKIKIKTLDCLVIVTLKSKQLEEAKNVVASALNQVYYEMYIDKINKQLKTGKWTADHVRRYPMSKSTNNNFHSLSHTTALTETQTSVDKTLISSHDYSNALNTSTTVSNYSPDRRGPQARKFTSDQDLHPKKIVSSTTGVSSSLNRLASNSRKPQESTYRRMSDAEDSISSNTTGEIGMKSFRKKLIGTRTHIQNSRTEYASKDQLSPFQNPEKQLKLLLDQLKSQDWQINFQALNKLRRIIQNHQHIITSTQIHYIVQDVLKLVESLRSSLSKNAMITLNELTMALKRQLDPELDFIFNKLIKKTIDANTFINQQVKKALLSLTLHCSDSKILTLLTSFHTTKAFAVKQSIVYVLQQTADRFAEKDLDRLGTILINFLTEASLEIRERTKKIVLGLLDGPRGAEFIKMIPPDLLAKIRKFEPKQEPKPEPEVLEPPPPVENRRNKKITVFPKQFDNLDALFQKCEASDWKLRAEGMREVFQICHTYPTEISQHKSSSRVIDILSNQIADPNAKVASSALNILGEIMQNIPILIENNLVAMTNGLFACLASQKPEIRIQAQNIFDALVKSIETWMLFQHLCNGAIYGIQKSRPIIIQKIIQVGEIVYGKKPLIYTKNMYTLINRLVEDPKAEIVGLLPRLLRSCYELVGSEMYSNTKSKVKEYFDGY